MLPAVYVEGQRIKDPTPPPLGVMFHESVGYKICIDQHHLIIQSLHIRDTPIHSAQ